MKLTFLLTILCFITLKLHAATIHTTRGEVRVNNSPAQKGQIVKVGDEIAAVGDKSFVYIIFEDGTKILVKDGQIKLQKPQKTKENLIELMSGFFYSQKIKSDSNLKIKTKYASMGVRGTKFFVQQSDAETYLCVCEGKVEISNKLNSQLIGVREDATVKAGQKISKTKANDMMWNMAEAGLTQMDLLGK